MKFFIVLVVVVAMAIIYVNRSQFTGIAPPVVTGPGPKDTVLESGWGPEQVAGIFNTRIRERPEIEAQFEGCWTPNEGWNLTVEKADATSVFAVFTNSSIGGGFKVICRFGNGHGYKTADTIKVQGLVHDIITIRPAGVPDNNIILDPVRIVN